MEIGKNYARRMRVLIGITSAVCFAGPSWASPLPVFINEIHYDDAGRDQGEGVEIAAPAGTDLEGWQLVFYDGNKGKSYATIDLHDQVQDAGEGYGFSFVTRRGIQNGAPDGLALVDAWGQLLQFLSYEGTFEAVDGVANGLTSMDIGVEERSDTIDGWSLQLTGRGTTPADFDWVLAEASFGSQNRGQQFGNIDIARVPTPATLLLLLTGLPLLARTGRSLPACRNNTQR